MVVEIVDPEEVTTVYVTIGNSDDGLAQREWARFHRAVGLIVRSVAEPLHGEWLSEPSAPWQNACWGFGMRYKHMTDLRNALAITATTYRQDSIALVSGHTHMIEARA